MTKSVKGSVFANWKGNADKIKSAEEVFEIHIPEFKIEKKKVTTNNLYTESNRVNMYFFRQLTNIRKKTIPRHQPKVID